MMLPALVQPLVPAAKQVLRRWAQATRAIRTLPDYLIIGTQKGGTTSLYNYLIRHPQVLRATTTEVHFFDENFPRGEDWYRGHFPTAAYRALLRSRRGAVLAGEVDRPVGVDQVHPALDQAVLDQERVGGMGDHVDECVADTHNVVPGVALEHLLATHGHGGGRYRFGPARDGVGERDRYRCAERRDPPPPPIGTLGRVTLTTSALSDRLDPHRLPRHTVPLRYDLEL